APTPQLGNQFVARTHVGSSHLAVALFLKAMHERGVSVTFPDEQVECRIFFGAGTKQENKCCQQHHHQKLSGRQRASILSAPCPSCGVGSKKLAVYLPTTPGFPCGPG